MPIQSSVSPASGWNLYGSKNEKEKERETTNSIIPSKQSKKNTGIHLYFGNIRYIYDMFLTLPWLHVHNDESKDVTLQYAIEGYPTKIIVNPEGCIAKVVSCRWRPCLLQITR